jgi:hypothetical protein
MDVYGGVISFQYTHGWKTYGLKYSYDRANRHRCALTMRCELLQPFSIASQPDRQLLWTPIERYLGSSAFNASGREILIQEAELHYSLLLAEEQTAHERRLAEQEQARQASVEAIRAFREKFT